MKTINFRLLLTLFAVVFIVSYFLGVLRWQWGVVTLLYGALNIPFGIVYLVLEKYFWNTLGPSHWLNGEWVSISIWLLSVIFQAIFYYYLMVKFWFHRRE
ncbi:MAG: hypothetical protein M0P33_11305 [Massilibacteroides sp.]|nr:hypothetical protein [Massilibacteroides sp.]